MSPDYPRHLAGFLYLGRYRYFLTFCTYRRRRLFATRTVVNRVLEHFRQAAIAQNMAILAFCFMPDHLHLLVEGMSERSSLLEFVRAAKQRSGFAFSRMFGIRLWQRYGYERVLRNDENALSVAAYVVANPVRARLVEDIWQYPYVGSDVYAMEDLIEVFRHGRVG